MIRKIWNSSTQRVMSLTSAGMLLGLLVDMLTAARLGTGKATDAIVIALSLPIFVDSTGRDGTKFSAVPFFVEKRALLSGEDFSRYVSGLLNFFLAIGLCIVIGVELIAPAVVKVLAPGLGPDSSALASSLLRVCAPIIFFSFGVTVMNILLNSMKRFQLVALRTAISPAIVAAVILLSWKLDNTVYWIAAANTIGFVSYFLTLFIGAGKGGFRYTRSAWASSEELKHFFKVAALPTMGLMVRQGAKMVERMLASLVAVGGVSAYYFAFRIVSGTQAIFGGSTATTGLPKMTEHNLNGDKARMVALIRRRLLMTVLLSLVPFLLILGFHGQIIGTVYGRGSFGAESVRRTAQIFLWLSPSVVFLSVIPVLQSALYVQKAYLPAFLNMLLATVVNVALGWFLSRTMGLPGIALASTLAAVTSVANLLYLLRRREINVLKGVPGMRRWNIGSE